MSSVIAICNLALSNVGKDNINSLDETGAEARACRQFYELTRDTLLQAYPWRFARGLMSMAELAQDVKTRWAYAYKLPNDCLKVRLVRPDYGSTEGQIITRQDEISTPFDVDGGMVYCDLSPAIIDYTKRAVDPARFSPLFIDALSWHLAVRLAMPLTRDPKMRADAYQLAQMVTTQAQDADANDARESSDHESEYKGARA